MYSTEVWLNNLMKTSASFHFVLYSCARSHSDEDICILIPAGLLDFWKPWPSLSLHLNSIFSKVKTGIRRFSPGVPSVLVSLWFLDLRKTNSGISVLIVYLVL